MGPISLGVYPAIDETTELIMFSPSLEGIIEDNQVYRVFVEKIAVFGE